MAKTISDIMTKNPRCLTLDSTVREAARLMADHDIGDVIVTEEDGRVCGVVTDRDIVLRVLASNKDPSETKIGEICTKDLVTLEPNSSIDEAIKMMAEKAVRRIPVVQDGKPVGIVALGDLAEQRDPRSVLGEISAAPPQR